MLQSILSFIYGIAESIDKKFGWYRDYNYETAPYCGHHYSGHDGKLTSSDYHEGEGGKDLSCKLFGMYLTTGRNDKWTFYSSYWNSFKRWAKKWNVSRMEDKVVIYHEKYPEGHRNHRSRIWIISFKKFKVDKDGQMKRIMRVHKIRNNS